MQYMLLIYRPDETLAELGTGGRDALAAAFRDFDHELRDAEVVVAGAALTPIDAATSVRIRGGELLVSDGPFAETKEQLGGYYVVEADSLDDAIRWAARVPTASFGTVEVRPLREAAPSESVRIATRAGA